MFADQFDGSGVWVVQFILFVGFRDGHEPLVADTLGVEGAAFDLLVMALSEVALVDDGGGGTTACLPRPLPSMSSVYSDRINKIKTSLLIPPRSPSRPIYPSTIEAITWACP